MKEDTDIVSILKRSPATVAIVVFTACYHYAYHLFGLLPEEQTYISAQTQFSTAIIHSTFIHMSTMHLISNLAILLIAGVIIEWIAGREWVIVLLCISILIGKTTAPIVNPTIFGRGISDVAYAFVSFTSTLVLGRIALLYWSVEDITKFSFTNIPERQSYNLIRYGVFCSILMLGVTTVWPVVAFTSDVHVILGPSKQAHRVHLVGSIVGIGFGVGYIVSFFLDKQLEKVRT